MVGLAPHLRRYWNPVLQPLYDRVAVTPLGGQYHSPTKIKLSDGRSELVVIKPLQLLVNPLTADSFAALLASNPTDLIPERPSFAAFPTIKRKRNACVKSKQKREETEFIRAYRVRLKPNDEQKAGLRTFFAAGRAYYNQAVDIINTISDGWGEGDYTDELMRDNELLGDGQHDTFWDYQFMRAEEISDRRNNYASYFDDQVHLPFTDLRAQDPDIAQVSLRLRVDEAGGFVTANLRPERVMTFEEDRGGLRSTVHDLVLLQKPWVEDVPWKIRSNAVAAAQAALDNNISKCAKNPGRHHFKLQFRSLKNLSHTPTESITVDTTRDGGALRKFEAVETGRRSGESGRCRKDMLVHLAPSSVALKGLGPILANDSSKVVDMLVADKTLLRSAELTWDKRVNKFYLIVKRVVTRPPDTKPLASQAVLAFDPGVRTFNAFSMPDGTHGELLHNAKPYLQYMCVKAATLQSKVDRLDNIRNEDGWTPTRLQKRTLQGRLRRTRLKLHHWMENMHYEAIKHTLTLADLIILPVFESSRMARRTGRVFNSTVARDMYTWAHYKFSQRMYHKIQVTANKSMVFSREPGTTKTCDACGHVVEGLGGAHVFRCSVCKHAAGRDIGHGSRGNLLAALGAAQNVGWDGINR
jgi:hypothetical protein